MHKNMAMELTVTRNKIKPSRAANPGERGTKMEVIVKRENVISVGACCVDAKGNVIHTDGHKQTVTTVTIDHGDHMEVVLPTDPRFGECVKLLYQLGTH